MKCKRCGAVFDSDIKEEELFDKGKDFVGLWVCPECRKVHFYRLALETIPIPDGAIKDEPDKLVPGRSHMNVCGVRYRDDEIVLDRDYEKPF